MHLIIVNMQLFYSEGKIFHRLPNVDNENTPVKLVYFSHIFCLKRFANISNSCWDSAVSKIIRQLMRSKGLNKSQKSIPWFFS